MNTKTKLLGSALVLAIVALAVTAANRPGLSGYIMSRSLLGYGPDDSHDESDHSETGAHDQSASDDLAHDHSHDDDTGTTSQITVWSGHLEVFIEHPYVVAGSPTKFITHVSDTEAREPRRQGPVTFVLRHESDDPITHAETGPARDGIYIPELTFPQPGQWDVSLLVGHDGHNHVVKLPRVRVYASQGEAEQSPPPVEIEGFAFLKEQQWEARTGIEPVGAHPIEGRDVISVPESALIQQGDKWVVYLQIAGETFRKTVVTPCCKENGFVEITAGLSEGQHVVTQGIAAVAAAAPDDAHTHDDAHAEADHQHEDTQDAHAEDAGAVAAHVHDDTQDAHTHDDVSAADDHAHEDGVVHLTDDQARRFNICLSRVLPGSIDSIVRVPGEIAFNADRVAHIVPQIPGIAREVLKSVGDTVRAGEPLGWLESTALGQAKIQYLSKLSEISCCSVELARAEEVHHNTVKLLNALESSPTLEELRKTNDGPMGKNRSELVSAYAEYSLAKAAYDREKQLLERKITSQEEYLKAESAFEKTDALYTSARDSVAFAVEQNLREAQQTQQVREMELQGAERNLYVLGLTPAGIERLKYVGLGQTADANAPAAVTCSDPNCVECRKKAAAAGLPPVVDVNEENRKLAWYPLRAPFDGTVIQKHLSLGESAKDDSDVFVVADLSTVWAQLQVHRKDLPLISKGRQVTIATGSGIPEVRGVIDYVAPLIDPATRTAEVRVVLDNSSGALRPGLFVTGSIMAGDSHVGTVVAKSSVQYVGDRPCVFVYDGHAYTRREIVLGKADGQNVEVLSGIEQGELIVTEGSFHLKAEIEKGEAGCGHGHAH